MTRALGRYELLRPLARGGMAEVFVARRRVAGVEKVVVIKRIRPERAGDPRFLELFVREARLSMSLTHQNIVPVFDFGRTGDQVFLAMERVEGKDLGSTLERGGPPPPLVAAFVAAEACRALAYAHARRGPDGAPLGIVHRDVTPRNVMLTWSGEVKLMDFGIAALAGEDAGRTIGTPGYMAPEQARGEAVDARADVYAIGLVLRELLTGEKARPGGERGALIEAARRGALSPWPDGDAVPAGLRAIAERATAAEVDVRHPTAAALGAALDDYLVEARAADRGDAPALRLAAWMQEAWRGAPEPPDEPAPLGDAPRELVDDGTIGTATERSLAATGDEPAGPDAPAALRAEPGTPSPPASRGRRRWPLGAGAVIAIGVAVAVAWPRAHRPSPAAIDAGSGAMDAGPIDAGTGALDAPALDAPALDAPALDAAARVPPVDAGPRAPRDGGPPIAKPIDASPSTPAPAARRVRINARPWAIFTVDDDPTEHETISTVELAPGPHRVRFRNPELGVERVVTITVPADRDLDHVEDLRR